MIIDKIKRPFICTSGLDIPLVVLLIFAAGWSFSFVYDQYRTNPGFALDFEPYYIQAQAIRSGSVPPYEVHGTKLGWNLGVTLPLTYAILIMPLSFLSLPQAEIAFCFITIGLVLGMVFLLRKMLRLSDRSFLMLLGIVLCSFPVLHSIVCGQASIIFCFITILSLYFYAGGLWLLSAILLGLAGSMKVVPLFLLIVFLSRRKFAYVVACMTSFILLQCLTAMLTGWEDTWFFWIDRLPSLNMAVQPMLTNQSIIGYLHRFLVPRQHTLPWINQAVPIVVLGGASLYFFFKNGFFSSRVLLSSHNTGPLLFEVGAMCILINLSTPMGWAHQFVWIYLPVALLLCMNEERRLKSRDIVLLTLGIVLLSLPLEMIDERSQVLRAITVVKNGTTMFGSLIIFWLLLARIWRGEHRLQVLD